MKRITDILFLFGLLLFTSSAFAQIESGEKKSSVPTAEEMKELAQKSEGGIMLLSNFIDAIDFSFIKEMDPEMKDEEVPFSQEEKDAVKEELQKGSDAIQNINFEKIEDFLKKIEEAVEDLDPEEIFKPVPKKD